MRLAPIILAGALLASCVSSDELEDARRKELRAEDLIASVEAQPASPERDALLEEAREVEARLEASRRELEALTREAWLTRGIEGASRGIGGDVPGGAGTILAGVVGAAMLYLRRKFGDADKATEAKLDAKLADLERRRDASREAQEIAPAAKGSGVAAQSGVAQAARLARATQAPSYDPLRWSGGAGVPMPPPTSSPSNWSSN
jgi:hypothetical protein